MLNYCSNSEEGFDEMIKDYMAFRSEREKLYSCKSESSGIASFYDDKLYTPEVAASDIKSNDVYMAADAGEGIQCSLSYDEEINVMKHAFRRELEILDTYAKQLMANDGMLETVNTISSVSLQGYPSALTANSHVRRHRGSNTLTSTRSILCLVVYLMLIPI